MGNHCVRGKNLAIFKFSFTEKKEIKKSMVILKWFTIMSFIDRLRKIFCIQHTQRSSVVYTILCLQSKYACLLRFVTLGKNHYIGHNHTSQTYIHAHTHTHKCVVSIQCLISPVNHLFTTSSASQWSKCSEECPKSQLILPGRCFE